MIPPQLVIISGCSGGGKSTLLAELKRRGHQVVEEPGRRIVREELATGGTALPWRDMQAFVRRLVDVSLDDRRAAASLSGPVFFDRGLIDALAAYRHFVGRDHSADPSDARYRYHPHVFFAPPWPELFEGDAERKHGLDDALAEYDRLADFYPTVGYHLLDLPKLGVAERADFVLAALEEQPTSSP